MKLQEINIRDPFVLIHGGKFYLYGTAGENAWSGKAKGFTVFVSDDLQNFEEKNIFVPSAEFWADENFWAPEVHEIDGEFYLFGSFYRAGSVRKSHILVCDRPDGAFLPLPTPLTPEGMECLDATFFEEGGKRYTVFCHEWKQCHDGEMMLAELDENLNLKTTPKLLFRASEAPWTESFGERDYVTDGPFLHRMKSGKLLMLWSSNGKKGYAMGMSVAENIEGPWTHIEKPLVENDGGHGMLFENDGKLFITYHFPNLPNGTERPYVREVKEDGDKLILI